MNSFKRIVSFILGILLMFVVTQLYFALRQDTLIQEVVSQETKKFADNVSEHGYITETMFNQYLKKINNTGNLYDIKMIHEELCYEPEYRFKTADEIIEDQNNKYEGSNEYHYHDVVSEKPVVQDQEPPNLTMNNETNESVMNNATKTEASTSHIHTSDCYEGANHDGKIYIVRESRQVNWTLSYLEYRVYCDHCGNMLYKYRFTTYWDPSYDNRYIIEFSIYGNNPGDGAIAEFIVSHDGNSVEFPEYTKEQEKAALGVYFTFSNYSYKYLRNVGDSIYYVYETTIGELRDQLKSKGYPDSIDENINFKAKDGCCSYSKNGYLTSLKEDDGYMKILGYSGANYELPICTSYWSSYYTTSSLYDIYKLNLATQGTVSIQWAIYQCTACGDYLVHIYDTIDSFNYLVLIEKSGNWNLEGIITYLKGLKEYLKQKSTFFYVDDSMYDVYLTDYAEKYTKEYLEGMTDSTVIAYKNSYLYFMQNKEKRTLFLNSYDDPLLLKTGTYWLLDRDFLTRYDLLKHNKIASANLACNQIIVSLVPTHAEQNIYVGDREHFITTAVITYLDGSKETVICNSTFNVNVIGYNQTAIITYYGLYKANEYKTFSASINVNVIAKSKSCANGHIYWLAEDGSDPGCPYCKAWLESLVIDTPQNAYLEMYQNTTLESNGLVLRAKYLDGKIEYVTTGYVHNLDAMYIGTQTVTIGYKGLYANLEVRTLKKLKQCTICGRYYELYPDGSDPGCPYCMALTPVFTGNILTYYKEHTLDDVLDKISEGKSYNMLRDDEIRLIITKKSQTMAAKLMKLFGVPSSSQIKVWYSAKIRDSK